MIELLLYADHCGGIKRQIYHSSYSGYYSPVEELDEMTMRKAERTSILEIHLPLEQPGHTGLGRDSASYAYSRTVMRPFKHSVSQQVLSARLRGVLTKNTIGFQISSLEIPSVLAEMPIPFGYLLFPHSFSYQKYIEYLLFS